MDDQMPLASGLAIDDGRIVALGEGADIQAEHDGRMEGVDLEGSVVIPGLTDAHIHLEHYGLGLRKVDCETGSLKECLARVGERAQHTPEGEWIQGHGWNQNDWEHGFGSAADLDAVSSQHPIYLTAKSLHAGWANSIALSLADRKSVV